MTRYIAFLRGINVGGAKKIKMDALKSYFEMPGFENVVTYIQSGNVLFDSDEKDNKKLAATIHKQLANQLGYEVPVVIRSIGEIKKVLKDNPYKDLEESDNRKLYITFLSDRVEAHLHTALDAYKGVGEELIIKNSEVYIITEGIGNSKLTINLMERKLGGIATMRNLATVTKILEL